MEGSCSGLGVNAIKIKADKAVEIKIHCSLRKQNFQKLSLHGCQLTPRFSFGVIKYVVFKLGRWGKRKEK